MRVRAYGAPLLLMAANAVLFAIGLSLLYPIYVDKCERAADGAKINCSPQHIDLFLLGKIGEFLSNDTFVFALVTTVATVIVAYFTRVLARIGHNQHSDARVIQRAYVGMSHVQRLNPANRKLNIQIKNTGQTPARIMGVKLGYVIVGPNEPDGEPAPPPKIPPYERTVDHPSAQAFLHAGDFFVMRQGLNILQSEFETAERKENTLYVIGLVEYVDVFEVWHRAGYARRYAPGRAQNNLPFVSEGAYSYDIVISESERLTGK